MQHAASYRTFPEGLLFTWEGLRPVRSNTCWIDTFRAVSDSSRASAMLMFSFSVIAFLQAAHSTSETKRLSV